MAVTPDGTSLWWEQPYNDGWTMASLMDAAGARHADRPAVIGDDGQVHTHGDIRRGSACLRAAILTAAARTGTRTVACLATLDAPWFIAIQGILTSGLAYAAMDPESPDGRLQMGLEDCGAGIIVADAGSMEKAERLAAGRLTVIQIEDASTGESRAPVASVDPDSPAAYIFTSGSTGRPKAVVRSQRSMAHAMYTLAKCLCKYAPRDIMLYPGSPGHIGTLNDALSCMLAGFRSIPMDIGRVDLRRICELLVEHQATVLALPPTLLRLLVREIAPLRDKLALRVVIASGEPLLRSDVKMFFEMLGSSIELAQNYGSTETGPMYAGFYRIEDAVGMGSLPLRHAHHGCELEILDDTGRRANAEEVGEVVVRSKYLADGYLNAPPDQASRFGSDARGRFFRIGDRGSMAADGSLVVAGRADRQIKMHGRRFELGDVESAILSDSRWAEAAAVQLSAKDGGSTLVAVVRPLNGIVGASNGAAVGGEGGADVAGLRERLGTLLPVAAIPQRFVVVNEMPRTMTGKMDLNAVKVLADGAIGRPPSGRGGPVRGSAEGWVADLWQNVLGIERPGREDRFSDLGGDSVAAIELSMLLEKRFGLRLSLDRLVELQTIAAQVGAFERGKFEAEPVRRLRRDGCGPICVLVPGAGGHAWVFAELVRQISTPCDVHVLSLVDLSMRDSGKLTRESVADAVASAIQQASSDTPRGARQVVMGGYSFGAVIASDIAGRLRERGVHVDRMLLLDPSPLDGERKYRTIRHRLASLRSRFRSTAPVLQPPMVEASPAAAELNSQVKMLGQVLGDLYLGQGIVLPDLPVSMIVSDRMTPVVQARGEVLGKPVKGMRVMYSTCGHLDLLRLPRVAETARWIAAEIGSVEATTP